MIRPCYDFYQIRIFPRLEHDLKRVPFSNHTLICFHQTLSPFYIIHSCSSTLRTSCIVTSSYFHIILQLTSVTVFTLDFTFTNLLLFPNKLAPMSKTYYFIKPSMKVDIFIVIHVDTYVLCKQCNECSLSKYENGFKDRKKSNTISNRLDE